LSIIQNWAGYLHFFQKALSKIPSHSNLVVYRGIDMRDPIITNYKKGRKIHWSAYSSTTLELSTAKQFATKNGIIIKLETQSEQSGKSIAFFSPFKNEEEILLSPNLEMIVTKEAYEGYDGFYYVELLQLAPDNIFVF